MIAKYKLETIEAQEVNYYDFDLERDRQPMVKEHDGK